MSQPVFYHSNMPGFPQGNTRVEGGFIAVLDACLVNGANLSTAISLTQTGGVATAAFAGNHNFAIGDSVLVEGATPTAYNGRQTVTAKTSDSISFAVPSGTASPASGTVTVKHPGAGWTKTWSDGNKAAYRSSTADGGVGAYLQIEDDNPYSSSLQQSFRWRVCEGHTGLDTAARLATAGRRFFKAASTVRWVVVADAKTAYINTLNASDTSPHEMFAVGEVQRMVPTDEGAWIFPGHEPSSYGQSPGRGLTSFIRPRTHSTLALGVLRNWSGFAATADCTASVLGATSTNNDFDLADVQVYQSAPNPLTGAVGLFPIQLLEKVSGGEAGEVHRGTMRGVYQVGGLLPSAMFDSVLTARLDLPDLGGVPKQLLVLRTGAGGNEQLAFDLTGPWG